VPARKNRVGAPPRHGLNRKALWLVLLSVALLLVARGSDPTPLPTTSGLARAADATSTEPPAPALTSSPAAEAPTFTPRLSPPPVPPTIVPTASLTAEPTSAYPVLTLEPVDPVVRAYPGPIHYEGDLLTIEINAGEDAGNQEGQVRLQVGDRDPHQVTGTW
jgi:hypothetical protein